MLYGNDTFGILSSLSATDMDRATNMGGDIMALVDVYGMFTLIL